MAKAPLLRDLLKQRDALNKEIFEALKREYPIGAAAWWRHGVHEQQGRVIDHWEGYHDPMIQVENVKSGKKRHLTAAAVVYYEDR